jgi:uncharacterized protein YndB with AHSA1/START domain
MNPATRRLRFSSRQQSQRPGMPPTILSDNAPKEHTMNKAMTMSEVSNTDALERSILIQAPRERIWRALTDAKAFGQWFGANLPGSTFEPGQHVRGPITICGHEHVVFDARIDRVEPQDLMSYFWHPYAVDPAVDYSKETPTLVTFTLQDADNNATLLTVVESGFDQVPPQRRVEAFAMNSRGWEFQLKNIANHVSA